MASASPHHAEIARMASSSVSATVVLLTGSSSGTTPDAGTIATDARSAAFMTRPKVTARYRLSTLQPFMTCPNSRLKNSRVRCADLAQRHVEALLVQMLGRPALHQVRSALRIAPARSAGCLRRGRWRRAGRGRWRGRTWRPRAGNRRPRGPGGPSSRSRRCAPACSAPCRRCPRPCSRRYIRAKSIS